MPQLQVLKSKQKDASRKLYQEDILLLKEMEMSLLRRNIKINQKELIGGSVRFALANKEAFLKYVSEKGGEDRTRELFEKWLKRKPVDFGKNFLEEVDTTF